MQQWVTEAVQCCLAAALEAQLTTPMMYWHSKRPATMAKHLLLHGYSAGSRSCLTLCSLYQSISTPALQGWPAECHAAQFVAVIGVFKGCHRPAALGGTALALQAWLDEHQHRHLCQAHQEADTPESTTQTACRTGWQSSTLASVVTAAARLAGAPASSRPWSWT